MAEEKKEFTNKELLKGLRACESVSSKLKHAVQDSQDEFKSFCKKTTKKVGELDALVDMFLEGILRIEKELLVLRIKIDSK